MPLRAKYSNFLFVSISMSISRRAFLRLFTQAAPATLLGPLSLSLYGSSSANDSLFEEVQNFVSHYPNASLCSKDVNGLEDLRNRSKEHAVFLLDTSKYCGYCDHFTQLLMECFPGCEKEAELVFAYREEDLGRQTKRAIEKLSPYNVVPHFFALCEGNVLPVSLVGFPVSFYEGNSSVPCYSDMDDAPESAEERMALMTEKSREALITYCKAVIEKEITPSQTLTNQSLFPRPELIS